MPRKKVKVVERKLGREDAWGQADNLEKVIEVDPRLSEKHRLTVVVHESLHLADWDLSESRVTAIAPKIAKVLWEQGYRRIRQ